MPRLRRLFQRAMLGKIEVNILKSILNKVVRCGTDASKAERTADKKADE